jgi:uncharacterized protein YaiE (UPF0345 family)
MNPCNRNVIFVLLFLSLAGCASSRMKPVAEAQAPYVLTAGESQVIFMRPSYFGGAIQSSVFDVTDEKNELIGIVSAGTKVRYGTQPGEHLFMVIGENADFMRAFLEPNKTYYARVTVRMGFMKARFSLNPVHKDELDGQSFKNDENGTHFVENTEQSRQWAIDNWDSISTKKAEYQHKWAAKTPAEKAKYTLTVDDGV